MPKTENVLANYVVEVHENDKNTTNEYHGDTG